MVRGDLEAAGRVRVHGTILGNVKAVGVLEVAAEGSIKGERVEAEHVRILGSVEALVAASGKVEIWRGGSLDGDVRAASLDIEEGASFTGRSEMRPAGAPPALPKGRDAENGAASTPEAAADQAEGEGERTDQPDSVDDDEFAQGFRSAPVERA